MSGIANESAFESSIEAHLLSHGWLKGTPQSYDVVLGLAPDPLLEFLAASQPDKWEQLCSRHGGEERTRAKVSKRVADEITARGTVDVLRRGVKDSGVTFSTRRTASQSFGNCITRSRGQETPSTSRSSSTASRRRRRS